MQQSIADPIEDWREGLPAFEVFKRECLGRWVVNHNGGDKHRIAAFIEKWEVEKKPVAMNSWFRVVVREQYKLLNSE